MGILSNLFPRVFKASNRPPDHDDFWYGRAGAQTSAGVPVTPQGAMAVSAVLACVLLIANTVASVPLILYREIDDDDRERAKDQPLYRMLRKKPNTWQTAVEFRQMLQAHLLLRGNAYARIIPDDTSAIGQLIPLHPDRVEVKQLDSGRLAYYYRPTAGPQTTFVQDEILHLRAYSDDGILGISPIDLQRETIGGALATQRYGNNFFGNYAQGGLYIKHPGDLSDAAKDNLRNSFDRRLTGNGQFRTVVLDEGMELHNLGITNDQAQFLETKKYTVTDIARIFLVPPSMIGDNEKGATFASVEQQAINFLQYTMNYWFTLWEAAVSRDLILDTEQYYAEFLREELLKSDLAGRYQAYAMGRQWGWLSPNDVLKRENMSPRRDPGGDAYLDPANMYRSDRLATPPDPSGLVGQDGATGLAQALQTWSWDGRRKDPEKPALEKIGEHDYANGRLH